MKKHSGLYPRFYGKKIVDLAKLTQKDVKAALVTNSPICVKVTSPTQDKLVLQLLFKDLKQITSYARLQSFQFHLGYALLFGRADLHPFGKSNTARCPWCSEENHT